MTHSPSAQPKTLAAKLQLLLRLRRSPDGHPPSLREVSNATAIPGTHDRAVSHSQVSHLVGGRNMNPSLATVNAIASALGAPSAYLLPGWDDLTALTVFEETPEARTALRLMQGLEIEDIEKITQQLMEMRRARGLADDVPETPTPPPGVDQPREGRPRRRFSFEEAAERAADDLEGS